MHRTIQSLSNIMEQETVFVVGYPKSGCTWLTRLVAELLGCPVSGFLGEANEDDMAAEGQGRVSPYRVLRAHQQWHELAPSLTPSSKVIYVVRDPRDATISGAHYFKFERSEFLGRLLGHLVFSRRRYYRLIYPRLSPESYCIQRMSNAILFGDESVSPWVRIPWKDHLLPYRRPEVLMVRYEDLLASAETECQRILQHVELSRDAAFVAAAIDRQSFQKKKREFKEQGDVRREQFMRVGKSGQWKAKFTDAQLALYEEKVGDVLTMLSYEHYPDAVAVPAQA
jgi:hypothetical protein